ncbi:hypothetical protein VCRA2119O381_920022 [Vibrio crassostreae]|nr:hypothetical protein VCRA2119O381_920022 [Vibrio crassostreae]
MEASEVCPDTNNLDFKMLAAERPKIQRFKDSKIQRFKGSKVQRFNMRV